MTFSHRRKPLARILLLGFAGLMVGGSPVDAFAQAPAPLRVDPVLLGLPPAPPEESVPAKTTPVPVEKKVTPEVRPVATPVVEAKPVDSTDRAPAVTKPVAAPQRPAAATPVPIEQTPVKAVDVTRAAPAESAPRPAAVVLPPRPKSESEPAKTSAMEPLRVDPALLGLPPLGAEPAVADRQAPKASVGTAVSTGRADSGAQAPAATTRASAKPAASQPPVAAAGTDSRKRSPGETTITTLPPLRVDPALLGMPAESVVAAEQVSAPAPARYGQATPVASRRVPYGPVVEAPELASPAQTRPPLVAATGPRDEDEVPDPGPALMLRSTKGMTPSPKDSEIPRPIFLSAHRMGGDVNREFNAEGDAELRKVGTVLNSDYLTYWPVEDEVEAEGNVRLEQGLDVITGPKMRMKLEDQVGYFEQPSYTLVRQPKPDSKAAADKAYAQNFLAQQSSGGASWNSGFALTDASNTKDSTKFKRNTMTEAHGEADRIDFEGENQVRLKNATYTTCSPGNNDWYAKADNLRLDYDREVGEGDAGTLYFQGVPILYSPWLSFSLNNERKSGFLPPKFGTSTDSGFELAVPYYWNIAPNMDATITPNILTKRGIKVDNEFRYLNTAYGGLYRGKAELEVLPGDRLQNGDNRYAFSLLHTQTTANGFTANVNYNKVSDDNYFTDLSSSVTQTSQSQLLQQGILTYGGGGWWNASVNLTQYQTIQPDPENLVDSPYKLLPQVTVNARKPDFNYTDLIFMGQYTHFTRSNYYLDGVKHNGKQEGSRLVVYPQVALPYVTPAWYVTPKFGLNYRSYSSLAGQGAAIPGSVSVSLPTFSLDSGMTFERTSNWFDRDYTQTLEPRLYYLHIPYKDQSKIPGFDTTGKADFNFAQIFSENQFAGWDRINNANQLTAAVTSRLLEPNSGAEIMRAMLGQRFYFARNKVTLPTDQTESKENTRWNRSDVLAAFSGQVLPRVYADSAVQYAVDDQRISRYSIGTRYQPEPGKVLNLAYRYNRTESSTTWVDQVDASVQWPLTGQWYVVGRYNFALKDWNTTTGEQMPGRLIESLVGLEYNGGCWVVRGVIQRKSTTAENSSTKFFIQLELSDFARIGSNPLSALKRSIQGYSLINQPETDQIFGE